jgi:hypothetical protein
MTIDTGVERLHMNMGCSRIHDLTCHEGWACHAMYLQYSERSRTAAAILAAPKTTLAMPD